MNIENSNMTKIDILDESIMINSHKSIEELVSTKVIARFSPFFFDNLSDSKFQILQDSVESLLKVNLFLL